MSTPQDLTSSMPIAISAADIERAKTDMQKAEDIAYTINHTITCLSLDVFLPIVGALIARRVKGEISGKQAHFFEHLKEWFTGEIAGDLGAVPITIAAQRMTPGFMNVLNHGMESLLGPAYRAGAVRATEHWAKEQGVAKDSPEYKAHADYLYNNEVSHLSQAAVWSAAAFALNVVVQKGIGSDFTTKQIVLGKLGAASLATTVVLGARALNPEKAHQWDQYTSQNIFLPMTKYVGGLFGIDHKTIERMTQKEGLVEAPVSKAIGVAHQGQLSALPDSPIKQ